MQEQFRNSIFSKNTDFPWQSFADETIIIDPTSNSSFELNEIGTFIWSQLNGKKTLGEILMQIEKNYQADSLTIENDLVEIIQELHESQLILPVE